MNVFLDGVEMIVILFRVLKLHTVTLMVNYIFIKVRAETRVLHKLHVCAMQDGEDLDADNRHVEIRTAMQINVEKFNVR